MSRQASWAIVDRYAEDHMDVVVVAYEGGAGEPVIVTSWTRDAEPHGEVERMLVDRLAD